MSQTVLASAIGVSFQQVQKYERGTNRISVSTLIAITEALAMPIAMFLEGIATAPDQGSLFANQQSLELLRTFIGIRSPDLQAKLADLIAELAAV